MEVNQDLITESSLHNVQRQVIQLNQTFANQKNTTSEDSTQLDQYSQTSGLREQILKII
jgi:flagellar biosynthesis chaperone FliJ